jgi:hypothetical protein
MNEGGKLPKKGNTATTWSAIFLHESRTLALRGVKIQKDIFMYKSTYLYEK